MRHGIPCELIAELTRQVLQKEMDDQVPEITAMVGSWKLLMHFCEGEKQIDKREADIVLI